ncbi:transcription elongation factor GreA [bacterium]|nr:transcription elongation factor GreA [bacterium]
MATPQGKEIILTREAFENCQKKLDYFKTHHRKAVAERIKLAKEFGDLSENAEYEDAKNEQAFIEGEILNLENTIRYAKVIDEKEVIRDIVNLGLTACIRNINTNETFEFTLVGSLESDPSNGYISNESPIGKAILGRALGEEVEIDVPNGRVVYKIEKIYQKQKQFDKV